MNRKAFTLIEVLVVISIISTLMIFLVPRLLGFQDSGKDTAVKAVMHSVQLAVESYNMENQVYPVAKDITIKNLCDNYLLKGGYISSVPQNPFSGKEYADGDVAGKIMYTYDDASGKYVITGYKRDGVRKLMELSNI